MDAFCGGGEASLPDARAARSTASVWTDLSRVCRCGDRRLTKSATRNTLRQSLQTMWGLELKAMQVRDGMSQVVLTIGPSHTLRDAARLMSERRVGAAVVIDPEAGGPGILTERDVLRSVVASQDPEL